MKKKIAALSMAACMAASVTACGGSKDSGDGTSASGNEEGKGLTVATSPDFPPFESLENNEIVGIEADIMNLKLWEGDKIFLKKLMDGEDFFTIKMVYQGEKLIEVLS